MAQNKSNPKPPPYLAYKTFVSVIDFLASSGLPNRIDKSLFPSQSGAVQGLIIAALEYLDLIDSKGLPTSKLEELVATNEVGRPQILEQILRSQYRFIFTDGFDLEKTTTAQLEEGFRSQGIGGETVRKCMTFFLQACKAAKIRVSPHINTPRKPSPSGSGRAQRPSSNGGGKSKRRVRIVPKTPKSIEEMLLEKFPEFDPAWPLDQQEKWFEAFNRFQKRFLGKNESEGDGTEEVS